MRVYEVLQVNKSANRRYWLLKSEPDEFGIDDLAQAKQQTTAWTGVRNYQVRNFFRDDISVGDLGFFYHSSCANPGIVGVVRVTTEPYPDPTQFDSSSDYFDPKSAVAEPRWLAIDVKLIRKLGKPLSLDTMRATPSLSGMKVLTKGNRLSVTPVDLHDWVRILKLTGTELNDA